MNPTRLFTEVARQNKLLKDTITSFSILLDEDPSFEPYAHTQSDHDEMTSIASFPSTHSPTLSSTSTSTRTSMSSSQQSTLETLIDLLDRQESRLDFLEAFGTDVLLNCHIPTFRGLRRTKDHPDEISVHEWCAKVSDHLKTLKSINTTGPEPKAFVRFIRAHLELKPAKLIHTLLERNRLLVRSNFPHEIPPGCAADGDGDPGLLFEYPFRLHVLRHPRALLNLLQSKFTDQKPTSLQKLNRIEIRPGDSLLLR
ncbi:hypothetical protein CROQUDRAFT_38514 [Cronartium quercuum f. sp. fusiforme G11]|uniref:Uncharacterized protein n=1 Tax=Cronartium quercuum f. sp. fusiforme G11 TaxID=708437 RepID=A0A9P6NVP3_9BASI|nr:hypothetical protein CROQUDRAFT_38514 [Cronartium quercuum f. sp. fusiforme G11]